MLRLILILRSREPAATTSASSWKLLAWKDCGRRLNGAMPSLTGAGMDNLGRLLLEGLYPYTPALTTFFAAVQNVRFWHKADMVTLQRISAFGCKADIDQRSGDVA